MRKLINYVKSLGWGKEDVKKILMLIVVLLITCVIFNKFLRVRVCGDVDVNNYNGASFDVRVDN